MDLGGLVDHGADERLLSLCGLADGIELLLVGVPDLFDYLYGSVFLPAGLIPGAFC